VSFLSRYFHNIFTDSNSTLTVAINKFSEDFINSAIERVVDGIEPNLRHATPYKKILKNSVATSLIYISDLVDSIPGPTLVSSHTFVTDPQVNAYFATVSDIQDVFSGSEELRAFFSAKENINCEEAYMLLCMNACENTRLGMDLVDGVIRHDVVQTYLNFSEHKIISPACCEGDVRSGIKQCVLDGLITHILERIVDIKKQKKELEIQRDILKSRLRSRYSRSDEISNLLQGKTGKSEPQDVGNKLLENELNLKKFPSSWNSLRYYLDVAKDVLAQTEDFIGMAEMSFEVTATGLINNNNVSQTVNTVHLNEIEIPNVLKRVVAIVRYPGSEMLDRQDFKLE